MDGFKTKYKNQNFRRPTRTFNIEHRNANIHWTRLRLGLSPLAEHLFNHNLIDSPVCKNCYLETESTSHYLLRCPNFAAERIVFLSDLLNVLTADYIASLKDEDIVRLFLQGDPEFPHQSNVTLAKMAMTFIADTNRFIDRSVH